MSIRQIGRKLCGAPSHATSRRKACSPSNMLRYRTPQCSCVVTAVLPVSHPCTPLRVLWSNACWRSTVRLIVSQVATASSDPFSNLIISCNGTAKCMRGDTLARTTSGVRCSIFRRSPGLCTMPLNDDNGVASANVSNESACAVMLAALCDSRTSPMLSGDAHMHRKFKLAATTRARTLSRGLQSSLRSALTHNLDSLEALVAFAARQAHRCCCQLPRRG